ncbi:TetR family transcriptional regulator [Tamaricihabitans halophyticus]|uniref:TetR family transcriptional regulator n=1 Tax=Tamaricihabitans halophyticus TaxID=1262583 RepID=A0A4R2R6P9_9PSEU|nr:TetR/AcrR family transcriptional regulator C-terminal domain-containing protein [Tamaricihabitans halophyticus]TCP57539.1 TetR family transcriptional regulator [Tamaricihabitans halophyticus]
MSGGRNAELSREKIAAKALEVLDEVGLDGLSMRRLATELGVQSPALYWHFRDKRQLLDHMADVIVLSAGMGPPRQGESWQDWLARRGRGYRMALLGHRDGARIVSTAHSLSRETIARFDQELAAMVALGFTPALALRTITVVNQYVTGYVLQEQAARPAGSAAKALTPQSDERAPATVIAAIGESGGVLGQDAFEHGLHVIVHGTEILLP